MSDPLPLPDPAPITVRFGVFELNLSTGELRKAGSLVRLRQQAFKLLAALVSRPGQVLGRDELRLRIWGDETFVDFDQGLNACIREIRTALGDSSDTPLYVETLPRRGYRFIAPLEPEPRPAAVALCAPAVPARRSAASRIAAACALLGAAGAGAVIALLLARGTAPRPADWSRITYRRGTVTSARFAPGGSVVYVAAWEGARPAIFVATPGSPESRSLDLAADAVVGISPRADIAYLAPREGSLPVLSRAPLGGGPAKEILAGVLAAALAPGGEEFAVARMAAGGLRLEYPIGHLIGPVNAPSDLRISPDAAHLALVEYLRAGEPRGHVVVFARDGRREAVSRTFASIEGLAWSPDGREVWFTAALGGGDHTLHAMALDQRERVLLPSSGRVVLHDVAADGRALLERVNIRGETSFASDTAARELSWLDRTEPVALSGNRVLLQESGEAGGRDYGIYIRAVDGTPPVRVGSGRACDLSADARTVVAVPVQDPDHVDLLPVGAGERRMVRHPGIVQYEWARLLPGGRGMVFVGGQMHRNMRVWVAEGTASPRPLTPEGSVTRPALVAPAAGLLVTGALRVASASRASMDASRPRSPETRTSSPSRSSPTAADCSCARGARRSRCT